MEEKLLDVVDVGHPVLEMPAARFHHHYCRTEFQFAHDTHAANSPIEIAPFELFTFS